MNTRHDIPMMIGTRLGRGDRYGVAGFGWQPTGRRCGAVHTGSGDALVGEIPVI